jgi:hypothetical protein
VTIIPELDLFYVHRDDTDHERQVAYFDVMSILEQILAARRGEPRPTARFTALAPLPLASQLPPFTFPTPVSLPPAAPEAVTGREVRSRRGDGADRREGDVRQAGAVARQDNAPPSTATSAPVMYEASLEARNSTVLATSSAVPERCIGTLAVRRSFSPGVGS